MRISDWSSDVCSSDLIRTLPPLYGKGTPLSERPKRPNCPKRPSRASPLGGRRVNFDQIVAAARQVGTLAPRASYWSFSWHETNCPVSEDGRGCTCTPEVTVQQIGSASGRERVCQSV